MEDLILKDLGEFQWFWAVLEERKKEEYLGLNAVLKEDLEEVGPMKLLDNLKSLNFI